jgi:hypothetical protein
MLADGIGGKLYQMIGDPTFTADSKHVTYVAVLPSKLTALVEDSQESKPYENINRYTFSSNGDHSAIAIVEGKQSALIFDGERRGKYLQVFEMMFSPDSKRFAFFAVDLNKKAVFVVDGKPFKVDPAVERQSAVFSPDSRHFAYLVSKASYGYVVLDGKRLPNVKNPTYPCFTRDSRHVIYTYQTSVAHVAVDGKGYGEIKGILVHPPNSIHFEDNGSTFHLIAKQGSTFHRVNVGVAN